MLLRTKRETVFKKGNSVSLKQVSIYKKIINWIKIDFFPPKFFPATILYLSNGNNGHKKYFFEHNKHGTYYGQLTIILSFGWM